MVNSLVKALVFGLLAFSGPAYSQSLGSKPGEFFGSWEVEKITDGFSDETRGIAHTKIGGGVLIAIKCDKPGPRSLYVNFMTEAYLGSDRVGRSSVHSAKMRLDDGPATDIPSPYYDGKSAVLFSETAGVFLRTLAAATPKRLRAQFLTYDGKFATIDLDVTGMSNAIYKTAEICMDNTFTQ